MDWSSAQQSDVSCEIPSLLDNSINMLLTNRSLKRFILPSRHFPSITFLCVVITKARILVPSLSGLNPLLWHSLDGHQPFIKPQFPLQSPGNFSLDSLRQPKSPAVTEGWKKCFCVRKLFLAISCVKQVFESYLKYGQIKTVLPLAMFGQVPLMTVCTWILSFYPPPPSRLLYKQVYKDYNTKNQLITCNIDVFIASRY